MGVLYQIAIFWRDGDLSFEKESHKFSPIKLNQQSELFIVKGV